MKINKLVTTSSLFLLAITVILSCSRSSAYVSMPNSKAVLMAGDDRGVATVWYDGTPVLLTDGSKQSKATGISIYHKDVYVVGWEANGLERNSRFWKNRTMIPLADENTNSVCTGITVVGNENVYISGYEKNSNGNNMAKYWKNVTPDQYNLVSGDVFSIAVGKVDF